MSNIDVIDVHHLLGRDRWLQANKPHLPHRNSLPRMIREFNSLGLQCNWRAYVLPFPSSTDGTYRVENDYLLRAASADLRIRPVLAVNVRLAKSKEFVDRLLAQQQRLVYGLVIWPILCGLDLDDIGQDEWLVQAAVNHRLPLTVHVGAGNEQRIGRVSQLGRYTPQYAVELAASRPEIKFNLSHVLRLSLAALAAARVLDNVFLDLSGITSNLRWYERGINVFPADDAGYLGKLRPCDLIGVLVREFDLLSKLMFGTTYPFCGWWRSSLLDEVAIVRTSGLTNREQQQILQDNAMRFYER